MLGVSKETDLLGRTSSSEEDSYRTVEEVLGILDPQQPLLARLQTIGTADHQTLETFFRRPRRRRSRISNLPPAA